MKYTSDKITELEFLIPFILVFSTVSRNHSNSVSQNRVPLEAGYYYPGTNERHKLSMRVIISNRLLYF